MFEHDAVGALACSEATGTSASSYNSMAIRLHIRRTLALCPKALPGIETRIRCSIRSLLWKGSSEGNDFGQTFDQTS